jgi:APA family basic amino acid/polyamine antiporter
MSLQALSHAEHPARDAALILGGPAAAAALSPLVVVCVLSSLHATILVGPRIYHAMAVDGLFLKLLGQVDARTGVPLVSLLVQAVVASVLLVVGSTFFPNAFEWLTGLATVPIIAFSTLTVAAVIVLRIRRKELKRTFRVPGYPLLPLLFVIVNVWVLCSVFASGTLSALVGLAIVALGVPFYVVLRLGRQQESS